MKMSDSSIKSRQCCIICKNALVENPEIEESMVITSLREKSNKNVQPSDVICPLCVGSIQSTEEMPQQCGNPAKQMKPSTSQETRQLPKKYGQATNRWNTIIVNQIPINVELEELISLFSQYGTIENTYLCKRVDQIGANAHKPERVARITFRKKDDAWKVLKASKSKLIKYNDHVLMITVVSNDFCPIQNLPDDCLREIFSRVSLVSDKFAIETVCKRWNRIGRKSWSSVTKVSEYWPTRTWRTIAIRASNYLRDVRLRLPVKQVINPEADFTELQQSLLLVAEKCVSLERLMISLDTPRIPGLRSRVFRQSYMSILRSIISKNQCLKRLSLWWLQVDDGFIDSFPADIQEIHLSAFDLFQCLDTRLVEVSKFQNLQALTLFSFHIRAGQLKGIETLVNLKILNLYRCQTHPSNIDNIVNLKKLEYLAIPHCHISDDTLSKILVNNKGLKELDISENITITDASMQYLCNLEYLEVLRMQSLHQVEDINFTVMTALRTLDCNGCSAITNESIQRLFTPSSVISHLFISDCLVNIECIKSAIRWASQKARPLVIFVNQDLYCQWEDFVLEKFDLYTEAYGENATAEQFLGMSHNFHVARYQTPEPFDPSQNDWDDYHLVNDDHKWCWINCERFF